MTMPPMANTLAVILKLMNISNFHPLEVMGHDIETAHQVGVILNRIF